MSQQPYNGANVLLPAIHCHGNRQSFTRDAQTLSQQPMSRKYDPKHAEFLQHAGIFQLFLCIANQGNCQILHVLTYILLVFAILFQPF